MEGLNKKEQKRLVVLNQVEVGKMEGWEAAEVLGLSLHHVRRVLAAYRKNGAAALAHGNRGRKPHNALDKSLKKGESRKCVLKPRWLDVSPGRFPFK